jgi:hypothetical protein
MLIVIMINAAKVLVFGNALGDYSDELIRVAEVSGRAGAETTSMETKLKNDLRISPTVSWSPRNTKVQLGSEILLDVSGKVTVGIAGFVKFPVTLKCKRTGISEVYWKELAV